MLLNLRTVIGHGAFLKPRDILANLKCFENSGAVARHAAQQRVVYDEDVDPDRAIRLLDEVTFEQVVFSEGKCIASATSVGVMLDEATRRPAQLTAEILEKTFRDSDIIARLGGDEFSVLTIQAADDGVQSMIARLQENLDHYNATSRASYELALSVGLARFDPARPVPLEELMASADEALYEDKRRKLTAKSVATIQPSRHRWDDVAECLLDAGGDVGVGLRGQVQVVGGVGDRRVPQVRLQDRQQRIDVLALCKPTA